MAKEQIKKIAIFFLLGSLSISAFFIRLDNFRHTRARTIDEIVYHRMGVQVSQDISQYHTIPFGEELVSKGRDLPDYFFEPLFKHPPLFTFMIAPAVKIFGDDITSSGYVSLLLGVLMIPMIYFLGLLLFNRAVGVLAAFFLWMDPVSIICSQKVWPDTPMAFFIFLSIWLFCYGLKKERDWFFVWSGFAAGLATNVKYPGILITAGIAVFALVYRRDLFRDKKFWLGLFMPLATLIPWGVWNYCVYGSEMIARQGIMHSSFPRLIHQLFSLKNLIIIAAVFVVALILSVFLGRRQGASAPSKKSVLLERASGWHDVFLGALGVFLCIVLRQHIFNSLQITFIPLTSWYMGTFRNEPPIFYVGRLMEFSLIYLFGFAAFFINKDAREDHGAVLRITTLVILFFFILWRNFQSRYILAILPSLLILAADVIVTIVRKVATIESFPLRLASKIALAVILILILAKTFLINMVVSYPNDLCYF